MLFLENVSLFVGNKLLFDEVNLNINPGDRIGVVGRNGTGKSHLMQLLARTIGPDSGTVRQSHNVTALLVKQELPNNDQSPLEYLRENDPDIARLDNEISTTDDADFGEVYSQLAELEEERYEKRAPQVLMGLGLSLAELNQPMRNLSGGLRMRVGMAMALIQQPDVLLLDEPTNHLDLESTQWLIEYLKNYPSTSAIVMVTHDITLLKEVCTTTANLRGGVLTQFEGSYDDYRQYIETEERKDAQRNGDLGKKIAQHKQIYYKFRDLPESRAAQAVAQLKKAKKLEEQLVELVIEEPVVPLSFSEHVALQDPVIKLDNVSIGYNNKPILSGLNLSIPYGAKIGLLGRNGQGKSTLIKLLANKLDPMEGDVERRARLNIGYFSQDLTDELDSSLTVYEQFMNRTGLTNDAEIRSKLSRYGFPYEKTSTLIGHLSGGEKSRLLFCLICSQSPNLIILDEPTNHLDVETRESLANAMKEYQGSIILVSHDSDLHAQTMQQFWLVDHGSAQIYRRGLAHYQRQLSQLNPITSQDNRKVAASSVPKATSHTPTVSTGAGKAKKVSRADTASKKTATDPNRLFQPEKSTVEIQKTQTSSKKAGSLRK